MTDRDPAARASDAPRTPSLLGLARRVVDAAAGDEEVEAFAVRSVDTDIEVRDGELESLSSAQTRGVGVRVVADGRQGYASTAVVTDEGLAAALDQARDNAAVVTPDDANGLPDPAEPPALGGLVAEGFDDVPVADRIDLALGLEAAARDTDRRVRGVETARYSDARTEVALASTRGLELTRARTDAFAVAFVLAGDDEGDTQTGFGITLGRGPHELDVAAAGRDAARKAVRLLGADKPASRRVPVVLDPFVTAQFLGVLSGALDAEAVLKGRSLFAGRVGESVAADHVTLLDDGLHPGAPGTAPWDDEGVPQQRTPVIDDGVLQGFLHSTWTARRTGGDATSTGNARRGGFQSSPGVGPTNLLLEPGDAGAPEVIGAVDDGVYVQDVMGLHSGANPISGEFSVSFSGLRVRDGQLAEPIREAAVSSTIIDVLSGIRMVGADLRFIPVAGSVAGSTVLVEEMALSGH